MSNRKRLSAHGSVPVRPLGLVGRGHPVLHRAAETVGQADQKVRDLAARMVATLQKAGGYALAAPQVGYPIRLVVTASLAIANPVVTFDEDAGVEVEPEGCLSLPGRWFEVPRFRRVEVAGIDVVTMSIARFEATERDARGWQHEDDHLAGLLLVGRYPEVAASTP